VILWRYAVSRGGESLSLPTQCSIVPHFWPLFSGELSLPPVLVGTFPRHPYRGHQPITIPSLSQETQARVRSRSAPHFPSLQSYSAVRASPPPSDFMRPYLPLPSLPTTRCAAKIRAARNHDAARFSAPVPPFPLLVEQAVPS
jgi:hypothetical protein